ncbi:proline racemase family protein [Methyloraptor flagellatus]|jgi:4-hydroxyproline epimerase|uniref:4-hydroxyproline epimerase n=1 Tax=Methyloraptor flagellatus TaxID=3162530 RepID=A0AAU7XAB7_9HYPH
MRVIDSHTEGEPTRVIVEGGPDLGTGPLAERRARFARDFDHVRRFSMNEPRGFDALVGALLVPPHDPTCAVGIIFFNNVGFLGMCGHGTIGAAVTLGHMGRIGLGTHRFETPVGIVSVTLESRTRASVENVPARVFRRGVTVEVAGVGPVTGDVAWGGNWFFLVDGAPAPLELGFRRQLTAHAEAIRAALVREGVTGEGGAEIDHIELFGPPATAEGDSRNFVLCPGGEYDRSPCGTGTSAKLACLAAAGKLAPGALWVQESVVGSHFTARYRLDADGAVIPTISGRAFVTAEATLLTDPDDPFPHGLG